MKVHNTGLHCLTLQNQHSSCNCSEVSTWQNLYCFQICAASASACHHTHMIGRWSQLNVGGFLYLEHGRPLLRQHQWRADVVIPLSVLDNQVPASRITKLKLTDRPLSNVVILQHLIPTNTPLFFPASLIIYVSIMLCATEKLKICIHFQESASLVSYYLNKI